MMDMALILDGGSEGELPLGFSANSSILLPRQRVGKNVLHMGAGGGMVELIASLPALRAGRLFPTLNYDVPDAECPLRVVRDDSTPAGKRFINLNVTPQGQASGVLVQQLA